MEQKQIIASDLEHLLAHKYSTPEWIFLSQVRSTTGYVGDIRTADGIAINTYPSRGFEVDGFEIKVSRSDWLTELKNSKKADEIFRYCNKFWLVVSDKNIVQPGELPKGWGMLCPRGNGLGICVQATLNPETVINMGWVCALLRRATEGMVQYSTIKQQILDATTRGRQARDHEVKSAHDKIADLQKSIAVFEAASGVTFDRWSGGDTPENVGNALRRVLAGEKFNIKWNLESAENTLNGALREIKKIRKDLGYVENESEELGTT